MPHFVHDLNARLTAGVFYLLAFPLLLILTLQLTGCATPPQTRALLEHRPSALPVAIELNSVPYFAQEIHQCGPASLTMALQAAGSTITPEQLVPQVYLPGREGSLQVEMLAATRRQGLLAYTLAPRLEDLLRELAAGRPVLVLQNLALNWYPVWHYAVAIGYNLDARTITLRSGPEPRQQLPFSTFENTWARSGKWALLALPPDQIPVTANAEHFLDAALALESTGQTSAARSAYRVAALRWPDQFGALIGLGNTSYVQRDFVEAERAFRAATILQPDAAIAYNNLADTLMQLGDLNAALRFAQTAVWLGGAHRADFEQTLQEITARISAQPNPSTVSKPAPPSKH